MVRVFTLSFESIRTIRYYDIVQIMDCSDGIKKIGCYQVVLDWLTCFYSDYSLTYGRGISKTSACPRRAYKGRENKQFN